MNEKVGKYSLEEFCITNNRLDLLRQWNSEKNGNLLPSNISSGSSQKVWWIDELGHEWNQSVYSRCACGYGCPICSGRVVLPGFNDLASLNPNLAEQWHPTKNGTLTPQSVRPGSSKKVWWICEKGHEWQATIASRSSGTDCPVCANRKILPGENDLATTHPQLAAQWHPTKNGTLTPQMISHGYDRKVWWLCSKGHEWQASPNSRVKTGAQCPVCSNYIVLPGYNDLATTHPKIAAQWHPTMNGDLTPRQIVAGSNRSIWWQCNFGHKWCSKVVDRTRGTNGCPYCSNQKVQKGFNDLATTHPKIAAQWHPTLNGKLAPEMVTAGSTRRVWWRCSEGHTWRTAVYNRAGRFKQTECPVCSGNAKVKYRQRYYETCFTGILDTTLSMEAVK